MEACCISPQVSQVCTFAEIDLPRRQRLSSHAASLCWEDFELLVNMIIQLLCVCCCRTVSPYG